MEQNQTIAALNTEIEAQLQGNAAPKQMINFSVADSLLVIALTMKLIFY